MPAAESTLSSSRRALVVEDELSLGALFQNVLQTRFGCCTALAGSVAAAIGHLEQERVDFVVCDLALAGCSGLDLAARPHVHQPGLARRLLIITATAGRADLAQAIARSELRVLYKPFSATVLVQAVEQACGAGT